MEITQEKDNFLTNRKEVEVAVEKDDTPSYPEAKQIVAKEFDEDSDTIAIKKVEGQFGTNRVLISAFIYGDEESKQKFQSTVDEEREQAREEQEKEKTEEAEESDQSEQSSEDSEEENQEKNKDKEDSGEQKEKESESKTEDKTEDEDDEE